MITTVSIQLWDIELWPKTTSKVFCRMLPNCVDNSVAVHRKQFTFANMGAVLPSPYLTKARGIKLFELFTRYISERH